MPWTSANYDPRTAQPTEGTVVDADEDLVALCARMQDSDSQHCAILYCEERVADERPSRLVPPYAEPAARLPLTRHAHLRTGLRMALPSFTATSKSTALPCFSRSLALESRRLLATAS